MQSNTIERLRVKKNSIDNTLKQTNNFASQEQEQRFVM